jgi:basic amino acid/polyamine antiporter, APA family
VFCATCAYLPYATLRYTGFGALVGVAVLAVGAVVLAVISRRDGGFAAPDPQDQEGGS